MGRELILETTFLIDLEREVLRGEQGAASLFLASIGSEPLYLTPTIAGELAAGPRITGRPRWASFMSRFPMLPISEDACWEYGQLYRYLRENGLLIGNNDLWIASVALAHHLPVVTANEDHFRRVPGLEVLAYREL